MKKSCFKKSGAKTVALAIALPNLAFATTENVHLPTIQTNAAVEEQTYYTKENASEKRTQSILDTSRSVQVLNEQYLKDQNLVSLQQALSTTPGITFGSGEGGGGYGDKINLRGYDASANITLDGLRDPALTTRTDVFNYQDIEIIKGANSIENGVGQISGGINLVSKKPKKRDFTDATVEVGTHNYRRATADLNQVLDHDMAVRLNVMAHQNDYAGRDVEDFKRFGFAPSFAFGINEATKAILSYYYQKDENIPLYGVPFFNGQPVPGISDSTYYGLENLDKQNIETNIGTFQVDSKVNEQLNLHSITRYSHIKQDTNISALKGAFCGLDGLGPVAKSDANPSGFAAIVPLDKKTKASCKDNAGYYLPAAPRGYVRNTTNTAFANDTSLTSQFNTGFVGHTLVTGAGFSFEEYDAETGWLLRDKNGMALDLPKVDLYHPDPIWHGETNFTPLENSKGSLNTYSAYIIDTLKFSPQWLFNIGVRYDRTEGTFRADSFNEKTKDWSTTNSSKNENLLSYGTGLTYKPTLDSSVYVSYSNAQKPTFSVANGRTCLRENSCDSKPETAQSYELGAKWEVNPTLLLTGSVFRTEQNKVRLKSDVAGVPTISLDGKNYVQGVELAAVGNILPQWAVTTSAAYLEGKYKQSIVTGSSSIDLQKGNKLILVPKFSGSLWTTYAINPIWQVGYGLTYQGKMYTNTTSSSVQSQSQTDAYLIHNASVTYDYNKNLSFKLLGQNLTNSKHYYTNVRANNGWAVPGETRRGVLSVNYKF